MEKQLCKLNCSYGKVSHTLKNRTGSKTSAGTWIRPKQVHGKEISIKSGKYEYEYGQCNIALIQENVIV